MVGTVVGEGRRKLIVAGPDVEQGTRRSRLRRDMTMFRPDELTFSDGKKGKESEQ